MASEWYVDEHCTVSCDPVPRQLQEFLPHAPELLTGIASWNTARKPYFHIWDCLPPYLFTTVSHYALGSRKPLLSSEWTVAAVLLLCGFLVSYSFSWKT
ncbi:hypothetical protein NPIL_435321 [Nephila pilipes]|uniref:Uncharacterized protein n=1 Tax=Nephila pilipes TaxID=299642 RepID=A0A8X6QE44_NEPPI|nr:hypothetical protein NPIL_435321 [Nephila pilipes]